MPRLVDVAEDDPKEHLLPTLAACGMAIPDSLTVLLVTDLKAFTSLLVSLGDLEARSLIRAHNTAVRACLQTHRGVEIAHLGDGVLAAFRSVRSAMACATAIHCVLSDIAREYPAQPLLARIGLHAGEPLVDDGRLFGLCVNVAVRLCEAAQPGSVLVSDVVRQLASGQKAQFEDRGVVPLKGLDDGLRVHQLVRTTTSSVTSSIKTPLRD